MKVSCQYATICLLTLLVSLAGAVHAWAQEQEQAAQTEIYFKRLAVAPVLAGHRTPHMDETLDDTLSCTIGQICVDDPAIGVQAGTMLTRLIQSTLKDRFGPNVIPSPAVQTAYAALGLDESRDTPRTLAHRLGRTLGADLMVVGTVWRYRDRGAVEGFPEKPASVAFALYLVEPESGRRLWRKIFDETQEFALKDMSKFTDRIKMGLKWLSADELARHGVKQALSAFPDNVMPLVEESPGE
jgi:hypothetical protein